MEQLPQRPLDPNTTAQEDLVKEGQRKINLIWETTQSQIAKVAVYAGLAVNLVVPIVILFLKNDISTVKVAILTMCIGGLGTTSGIIIGFYFSRTNHSAIGGVGKKDLPSDVGTR